VVVFTAAEWRAFIDGAKTGEFDFDNQHANVIPTKGLT
jgi:hypothetical protein